MRFAHDCAHCAHRIRLKIWPTVHHLLLHIVTFMLQPSKMQGEARNYKNRHFGALRAQLCALRARDHAVGLTVPAFLPDGPSVRILSLCDNSFYHFFLALFPNGGDPPCSSLSEPPSKREPPRFARRLIKISRKKHVFGHELPQVFCIVSFKLARMNTQ